MNSSDISDEQYEEISKNFADALNNIRNSDNPEEAKENLKAEIYNAANENGVEITEEIANIVAGAMDNILEENEGEITEEIVQDYFDRHAE